MEITSNHLNGQNSQYAAFLACGTLTFSTMFLSGFINTIDSVCSCSSATISFTFSFCRIRLAVEVLFVSSQILLSFAETEVFFIET